MPCIIHGKDKKTGRNVQFIHKNCPNETPIYKQVIEDSSVISPHLQTECNCNFCPICEPDICDIISPERILSCCDELKIIKSRNLLAEYLPKDEYSYRMQREIQFQKREQL